MKLRGRRSEDAHADTRPSGATVDPDWNPAAGGAAHHAAPPRSLAWWRGAGIGALALALALGLLAAVWLLARPLALLLAAAVIAQAMAPAASWLERLLPRVLAVVFPYLVVLLLVAAIGWLAVPPLVEQAREVAANAPTFVDYAQALGDQWVPTAGQRVREAAESWASGSPHAIVSFPLAVASSVLELVLVMVMSIYWLATQPTMRGFALSLFPRDRRAEAAAVLGEVGQTVGGYLRAAALDALIVAVIVYVGLSMIGVKYALVLALLAALGEVVPFAGPIIAAIPAVAVALLASPVQALVVLVFYVAVQQFEGYILLPNVVRQQADIPPLLAVFALLVGASVAGVLGAVIAIPLAGALRILVLRVAAPAVRPWSGASPGTTLSTRSTAEPVLFAPERPATLAWSTPNAFTELQDALNTAWELEPRADAGMLATRRSGSCP